MFYGGGVFSMLSMLLWTLVLNNLVLNNIVSLVLWVGLSRVDYEHDMLWILLS